MAEVKLRKAQRKDASELMPKLASVPPDPDFIPYVCHFDPNTILTKNGELLQIIKITGFNYESVSAKFISLRETIRNSIKKHIKTTNFAMWIHTIRRHKNIGPGGEFTEYFATKLNEAWEAQNNWRNQYVNELYLTIIIEGYSTAISNFPSLMRSFSFKSTRQLHEQKLNKSHQLLCEVVKKLFAELNDYGADLLGLKEIDGVIYSEPMAFFSKITNFSHGNFPLTSNDLSYDLAEYRLAFGNNNVEVVNNGKKHVGTIFSIKEYREISVSILDRLLQLPQEMIITQSIDFIDRNRAIAAFDYQQYILDISGDDQLKYISELDSLIESDKNSPTDYCKQQLTIMLINRKVQNLQNDISSFLSIVHNLGLIAVREDIFFEHCYWGQLPGNFAFLRRQRVISSARIGGFASLHNFPAGTREGNHWGHAVSIFRTVLGTPYFFNFHHGDNGHTIIIGPYGSGKTVLMNFLVCQSRKFHNKLYYFGYNRSAKIMISALSGNYFGISKRTDHPQTIKLNPLKLEYNTANRQFVIDWFGYLVHYAKDVVPKAEMEKIPQLVDQVFTNKITRLSEAVALFNNKETPILYQKLAIWYGEGKYAFIFDNQSENDWSTNLINAFELTAILPHQILLVPVIAYLLHRIEQSLDGEKTIIVLDEAWKLIDNYALGGKVNEWLLRLQQKNCIVLFATESINDAAVSNITKAIHQNIATQIYLPDSNPGKYYKSVFGLTDDEFELLPAMSNIDRHFLLKHGGDSIIATLDLSEIEEIVAALSSTPETIIAMEEVQNEYGTDPQEWIQRFFEILTQITQEE